MAQTGFDAEQLGDLGAILLFQGLSRDTVLAALRGSSLLTLPAGATVLQPGESNSSIYVLLAGELAAHLDARNPDAAPIPIAAGECVGELSAIDGKPTSALVVAVRAATLLEIPGAIFRARVLTLPGVAGNLLLALADRMRRANSAALKTQREQLELQHLHKELNIARQLQLDMVPRVHTSLFPQRKDIEVCGFMEPAAKVGGNLFDCCFVDRQHLFFCIGDVTGQGMAAALSMSRAVSVLRHAARDYVMDPGGLLSDANAKLYEGNEANVFFALFCGYLNVSTGRLYYANAGHGGPLLAWVGGSRRVPVPKGALVGAVAHMSYLNCDLTLGPGDLLFCHTGGLTGITSRAGEEFGEQRLLDLLAAAWQEHLPELLSGIRAKAAAFAGDEPLEDDCTMLALRRGARDDTLLKPA